MSSDGVDRAEVSTEDDVDDADRAVNTRPASPPKGGRRRLAFIAGIVVLATVVVAAVALSGGSKTKPKPKATPAPPVGFTTLRDTADAFTLNYPVAWTPTKSTESDVPLQASIPGNALDTMLVRVIPISAAVDTSNVDNIRAVTDAIISGAKVTVLKQQSLAVNGVPAYYYFYTLPTDAATSTTLVHSHFFLFPSPHEMVSLVFQTVDKDFASLATRFDQVVASVRTIPSAAGSATSAP